MGDSSNSFLLSPEESSSPLLRCSVESVYPRPVLTFSELSTGNGSPVPPPSIAAGANGPPFPQVFPSVNVVTSVNDSTGLYSSSFTYRLPAESIKVGTVYECKLELPPPSSSSTSFSGGPLGAIFTRKKRIKLIYPSSKSFSALLQMIILFGRLILFYLNANFWLLHFVGAVV